MRGRAGQWMLEGRSHGIDTISHFQLELTQQPFSACWLGLQLDVAYGKLNLLLIFSEMYYTAF